MSLRRLARVAGLIQGSIPQPALVITLRLTRFGSFGRMRIF